MWRTAAIVVLVGLTGCGTGILPVAPLVPEGHRRWIITVENASKEPARLMVAEDRVTMGALVGTAEPAEVPPNTTQDVVFTVPPEGGWAIFVNPSNERGPVLPSADVPPDARGRLPIRIIISRNGEPGSLPMRDLGPAWFGP